MFQVDTLIYIYLKEKMGKKGVLLDNGKAARSSMDLYWKAAQKKANTKDGEKKEVREEDMQDRV